MRNFFFLKTTACLAMLIVGSGCGGGGGSGSTSPAGNNAPTAALITTPQDLSVYVLGDPVHFEGGGTDPEDGELAGASLVWTSDHDGQIGTGRSFSSSVLSAGTHRITLTAYDSDSATASAACLIRISNQSIETYPSADADRQSELYRVEVNVQGDWADTHAYQYTRKSIDPSWHKDYYPWVHWTTIGLASNAKANVRVTRLERSWGSDHFTTVEILPSRYGITPVYDSDTITFEIGLNQKVYVRVNGQDSDTLFVFAAPLKPPVPAGAKYFGPGVHVIGVDHALAPSETDVYFDGGAWVIGSLDITDAAGDVRIMGPGVLSGEFEVWENVVNLTWEDSFDFMMIHTDLGNISPQFNVSVSGLTIVGSPFYNLSLYSLIGSKRIDNIHILSPWTWNTDGLNLASNGTTTNTFVFNNDDTVHSEYIYDAGMSVSDCVFAGRNSFLIGYGYFGSSDPYHATSSNIDLILQASRIPFHGEIDGDSSEIVVDNQTYENISIDGNVHRLIYLAIEDTDWGASNPAQGNVRNLTFRNIQVNGRQRFKSVIKGKDSNNRIDNIIFQNLVIDGIQINNANCDQYFDIDRSTADVEFIQEN